MTEPTITAEDLALYALDLLDAQESARIEAFLRTSSEARREIANLRGDLALFAMGAEQHTPPAMTRQRLLKQVARERRETPISVPIAEQSPARTAPTPSPLADRRDIVERGSSSTEPGLRTTRLPDSAAPAQPIGVPRIVGEPAPLSAAAEASAFANEQARFTTDPQVFARDAQPTATSTSAHSVTMFEQHFAADAVGQAAEAPPAADHELLQRRAPRRVPAEQAIDSVEDRFVPSSERRDDFSFSSFAAREQVEEEPKEATFARVFSWFGWFAAAAAAVIAAFSLHDDFGLREQLSRQQADLSSARIAATRAETVLQTLQSPASQRFVLARTDSAPAPSGRVTYLPERGTLVFQGSNLETLQPYKTYELWLIPAGQGRQPVPAGTFKPDGQGYATVLLPQLPKGLIAGNFGVTIEDEGGSATPTLPILLVGQQS